MQIIFFEFLRIFKLHKNSFYLKIYFILNTSKILQK